MEAFKDLSSGVVAGVSSVVVGHPFDTVKVRLQTNQMSLVQCIISMARQEGLRGFYKGLLPPVLGEAVTNSVIFGSYGQICRWLCHASKTKETTLTHVAVAGAGVGVVCAAVISPAELIKIRLQLQIAAPGTAGHMYKGPWDCARKIFQSQGFRGLCSGLPATLIRDIPSFAGYFWFYEAIRRVLLPANCSMQDIPLLYQLLAGGVAGVVSWGMCYPVDVAKTHQQAQSTKKTLLEVTKELYTQSGPRIFLRGIAPSLIRAFPVNATIFYVYEWCLKLWAHVL